jgi:hypothetical protein
MRAIKLMPDYQCFPLWEASPGVIGNINPDDLPLSDELKQALSAWADEYDATLNLSDPASSGFSDVEAEKLFRQKGIALGERLRVELGGGYSVVVKIVGKA